MQRTKATQKESGSPTLPRAKGGFLSHVFMLMTGNGIAQALNAGGTLLLARFFAPDAFGVFALFVAAVSVVAVLGGGRYELSIMLPDEDEEAANVVTLSTLVLLGIAAFSLIIVTVFPQLIGRLSGSPYGGRHLWTIPLALLLMGLYQILSFWSGRMKRFRDVAKSRVCQAIGILGGQFLFLGLHGGNGTSLVDGWLLGQSIGTLYLLFLIVRKEGRFLATAHDWSIVRGCFKKYKNFPLYKAPYSFVSNAANQFVPLVLQLFVPLNVVGLYSMASRAVSLPMGLITSSMQQVFYEKAATELRHGRLEQFVTRILRIQIVLAMPVLVFISFDIRALFAWFLGPRWAGAGIYAAILAWIGCMLFLTSWLDRLFDVQGRQRLSLILVTIGNGSSLAGLYIALWYTHSTIFGLSVFTAFQVVYEAAWLVIAYAVVKFPVRSLLWVARDALASALIAVAVIGGIHAIFSGTNAIALSAAAVFCAECVLLVRYSPKGALTSVIQRLRSRRSSKTRNLSPSGVVYDRNERAGSDVPDKSVPVPALTRSREELLEVSTLPRELFQQWDDLVSLSPHGTVFHYSWWLEATGWDFKILGCWDKSGRLIGGIPLPFKKNTGFMLYHSPLLTPYLGPVFDLTSAKNIADRLYIMRHYGQQLGQAIRGFDSLSYLSGAATPDLQGFLWAGFHAELTYTFRFEAGTTPEMVSQGIARTHRQKLKRHGEIIIEAEDDLSALAIFSSQTFERQGIPRPYTETYLRRLCQEASRRGRAINYVARDLGGRPVAALLVVNDDRVSYQIVSGMDFTVSNSPAAALLTWRAICDTLNSGRTFDFEGSRIPGVEQYYRRWGAQAHPVWHLHKTDSFRGALYRPLAESYIVSAILKRYRSRTGSNPVQAEAA